MIAVPKNLLAVFLFFLGGLTFVSIASAEPTGELKSPDAGDEVIKKIEIEGRTRDIPDGFGACLFIASAEADENDGFGWPITELEIKSNRRFEYTRSSETDKGARVLKLVALPNEVIDELKKWRADFNAHKKRFGASPNYTWVPSVKEKGIVLAKVGFTVLLEEP